MDGGLAGSRGDSRSPVRSTSFDDPLIRPVVSI